MPKCHYEILGVDRDADDSTIKKSHRKLALKWHPDKNQENLDLATEQFRLVQAAYECLSDPHERKWYDDHREAILRGKTFGAGGGNDDDSDEEDLASQELYTYMTSFAFDGFDEDKNKKTNFYTVYHEVFIQIDTDEPTDNQGPMPVFGKADTIWDDVDLFYGYWENFVTRKTFGGLDKYDTRQAPDRRVRRLMEQENKKIRDKAKKKRNEIIRELVRFVRRRDPRVVQRKKYLEIENERKVEREKKKRQERLEREMEQAIEYAGLTSY